MKTKIRILGCGTANGVPSIARGYGLCNPDNLKNTRTRTSIIVETETTRILVDAGPDLRMQLLDAGINQVDAVLFTHDHADHLHGIDDLREINRVTGHKIPIYGSNETMKTIATRFSYVFAANNNMEEILEQPIYQPNLVKNIIENDTMFKIGDIEVRGFTANHGWQKVTAYRFNDIVYMTDTVEIYDMEAEYLKNIKLFIVGCASYIKHPIHANVEMVLDWVNKLKPERTILTHMGSGLDYDKLISELPKNVEPAFDGMAIIVN
ncbi:MAG: MBL fold metallo-hydrolase [Alphaproteobacteria bacterium]